MAQKQNDNIKARFGEAVRQRRRELSISQEQLAGRSGFHRSYISTVELGMRNPTLENIEKFAEALEISIADLFTKYGIEIKDQ
ncbi:helix-turn-helix domain-containing protein [Phormidesmis sp. 146-35]